MSALGREYGDPVRRQWGVKAEGGRIDIGGGCCVTWAG